MINELLKKFAEKKYLIFLLCIGILIMIVPDMSGKDKSENSININNANKIDVEKLEKILKKINSVSSCDIFVTYENQGENNYAYDVSSGSNKELEIKISDKEPLVKSVNNPKIRGIFVLVKGTGINVSEITHIIKGATGVPVHRIYVKIS